MRKLKLPWFVWTLVTIELQTILFKGTHLDLEKISWFVILLPGIIALVVLALALLWVKAILGKAR